MASLLIVVARAGMLALIVFIVTLFPWPDISPYLDFVSDSINVLYFMNPMIDMDTAFTLLFFSITIEVLWYSYKLVRGLITFVASGSFGNEAAAKDDTEE